MRKQPSDNRKRRPPVNLWEWFTGMVAMVLVAGLVIYGAGFAIANSECLSHGYRSGKLDLFFNQYCIKRVDQTDVVLPLGVIENAINNMKEKTE